MGHKQVPSHLRSSSYDYSYTRNSQRLPDSLASLINCNWRTAVPTSASAGENAYPANMIVSRALAVLLALSCLSAVAGDVAPVKCNGKEVPFTPGRYMVSMSGEWTRQQLNEVGDWLNTQAGTDEDYFELNNVVALISMLSGEFSYNAMDALTEKYRAQIDSVECDQMVATVSTRLYCRTTMLKEPLSAPSEYTVNVADGKALQAVKAQLGDLEAVEYQDADPSPAGSPQFTAKLSKELRI